MQFGHVIHSSSINSEKISEHCSVQRRGFRTVTLRTNNIRKKGTKHIRIRVKMSVTNSIFFSFSNLKLCLYDLFSIVCSVLKLKD